MIVSVMALLSVVRSGNGNVRPRTSPCGQAEAQAQPTSLREHQ